MRSSHGAGIAGGMWLLGLLGTAVWHLATPGVVLAQNGGAALRTPLTGKTVQVSHQTGDYKGAVYTLEFTSEQQMRWKGLAGGEKGKTGTETYQAIRVAPDALLLTWYEKGAGYTVTYTFNTRARTYVVVISNGEGSTVVRGRYQVR